MIIDDLAFSGEGAFGIKNLDGALLISSPDARALFTKASELDPDIRRLGISADGKLHPMTGPVPWSIPVTAGVGARTIVVTMGDKRRDLGAQLLTTHDDGKAPLFTVIYDLHKMMDFVIDRGNMSPGLMEPGVLPLLQKLKGVLGQMTGTLDVTDQGLAFWTTLELR